MTRSAPKEDTESAVALTHPRECTQELISALLNFASMGTFGAIEQKDEMSSGKRTVADVVPVSLLSGVLAVSVFFFCGECDTGVLR